MILYDKKLRQEIFSHRGEEFQPLGIFLDGSEGVRDIGVDLHRITGLDHLLFLPAEEHALAFDHVDNLQVRMAVRRSGSALFAGHVIDSVAVFSLAVSQELAGDSGAHLGGGYIFARI